MADLALEDLVIETSPTTGTGTYELAGPVLPYRGIVAALGNGKSAPFIVTDGNGNSECFIGTVTDASPDTLTRDKIIWSSNADAAVSWGVGVKYIRLLMPAYLTGQMARDARSITDPQTVGKKDNGVLWYHNAATTVTLNLPSAGAAGVPKGFTVGLVNLSTGVVNVDANGTERINGDTAAWAVQQEHEAIWFVSTGLAANEWRVASRYIRQSLRRQVYAPHFFA